MIDETVFYCKDDVSPGWCIIQCKLCYIKALMTGEVIQESTDAEKLARIRALRKFHNQHKIP